MQRQLGLTFLFLACGMVMSADAGAAASEPTQLAQAQPTPARPAVPATPAAPATAAPAADAQAPEEPIGNVATVTGTASVFRNNETTPLKVKDDIYLNDVVQTGASSALGITFSDATTFTLKANAQITIDSYVYEDGGKNNAGVFDVVKGTVAFAAAAVAKTGDMKITTPTATLGIRGTTGLVEVPDGGGTAGTNNIKLYPDADGRVGRIEVNDRSGARLGFLTQGASGFAVRPGIGGARVAAVPLTLSPQQIQRDQGFVRQVHSTQTLGRQVVQQQREFRRANPGLVPNNAPRRQGQNGVPGQNRQGAQQPGLPNRPDQPNQPVQPNRPGQLQQQPQQPGQPNRQGQQQGPGSTQPGSPTGVPPRPGQPAAPVQPGAPQQPGGLQQRSQPSGVQQPGTQQPSVPQQGLQRQPGLQQGAPGVQRPGLQNRPAFQPRRPPPKDGKKKKLF